MAYTDVWPCKRCGSKPELLMMGKNFYVTCKTCNSEKVNVHANNVDAAVALWNRANDPTKRGLLDRLKGMFGRKAEE